MPKQLWGDAIITSTYLINRIISQVLLFDIPFQKLQTTFPISYLRSNLSLEVFVCTLFAHGHSKSKLDLRAVKCVFIGYSSTQKGYKWYDFSTKKAIFSFDVTFFQDIL